MKTVQVKRVSNRREMDDFVRLPRTIYAGNPCYVPDLEADIRDTFDPRKNAGLDFTDIQPFVAYDGEGRAVGRIAGIINRRANQKWGTRNVRFGFIEFIDDARVSAALLHAVEQWGRERGRLLLRAYILNSPSLCEPGCPLSSGCRRGWWMRRDSNPQPFGSRS